MEEAIPRAILRRRTHVLVYRHAEMDRAGFSELENQLCVREKDRRGASWVSFKATLMDTDPKGREVLRLPGEVTDELLRKAWPRHTISDSTAAWPRRAAKVRFKTKEFPFKNSDQSKMFEYLAGIGPFSDVFPGTPRLAVAGTAAGKSYCSIRAWTLRGDVLLGTFAQMTHLENYKVELLKFTDLSEDEILVVDDGRVSLRRAMKHRDELAKIKVILVLHRTIWNAMQDKIEDNRVTGMNEFCEFVLAAGVGTHVSDEAHLEFQSVAQLAMLMNVDQTYYLTATPKRTEWMEDRVLTYVLPKDSALYIKSAPRLETIQVRYNTRPDEMDVAKSVNGRDYFDLPRFFDYLMRAGKWDYVEEMLTHYVSEAFSNGAISTGIIVAGKLEFLDRVVERVALAFPEKSVGNFSSRVKIADRPAELHKDIVVTTEKSFNGSVNPERMTHLIFLAPISSPVWLEQISGRLRGLDGNPCVFYDLWDAGFPKLVEQAKRRRTTLKKLSTSLTELEYRP
jgi:hypothetical protein